MSKCWKRQSEKPLLKIEKGNFYLLKDFKYRFPWDNYKYVIVPKGTWTNFASIPALGRMFISPTDETIVTAAIIHDYLVGESSGVLGNVCENVLVEVKCAPVSWKEAAYIMKLIMKEEGANKFKARMVYSAIRTYGFFARK